MTNFFQSQYDLWLNEFKFHPILFTLFIIVSIWILNKVTNSIEESQRKQLNWYRREIETSFDIVVPDNPKPLEVTCKASVELCYCYYCDVGAMVIYLKKFLAGLINQYAKDGRGFPSNIYPNICKTMNSLEYSNKSAPHKMLVRNFQFISLSPAELGAKILLMHKQAEDLRRIAIAKKEQEEREQEARYKAHQEWLATQPLLISKAVISRTRTSGGYELEYAVTYRSPSGRYYVEMEDGFEEDDPCDDD